MTHLEFSDFHNLHIQFRLNTGIVNHGVVVDSIAGKNNTPRTVYAFIPTNNMVEWKKASEEGDKNKMNMLEGKVDISNIVEAWHIVPAVAI